MRVGAADEEERAELVCQRLLLMLRRSTMELYYSAEQVARGGGTHTPHRVNTMMTLFH